MKREGKDGNLKLCNGKIERGREEMKNMRKGSKIRLKVGEREGEISLCV
jgi:hypothetical protein